MTCYPQALHREHGRCDSTNSWLRTRRPATSTEKQPFSAQ